MKADGAPPVDAAAREAVRSDHARSLIVEAGAGTGKTTALVSRIVAIVAGGVSEIDRLAAITFTEAAAAELRDRVRSALESAAAGRDPLVTGDDEREPCAAALDSIDDAAISTLHGFAQRIVAAYPLEAGLPPSFDVLDAVEASIEIDRHWEEFASALLDDPAAETTLLAAFVLGIDLPRLRTVALALHRDLDRLGDATFAPRPLTPPDAGPVIAALDAALADLPGCLDAQDKLAEHLTDLVPYRDSLRAAADAPAGPDAEVEILDLLANGPKLERRAGQKGNWPDVDAVRALCRAATETRAGILRGAREAVLHTLAGRITGFVRDYAAWRRAQGRLEFQDLLVLAVEVLRCDPSVLAAMRARFRVVLVDEFQDTDPLQVDLAVLLASSEPDAGSSAVARVALDPGRLFLVGDPKQSIYRFRRADLEIYAEAAARDDLSPLTLAQSFRSVPGILGFVNHVFGQLLGAADPGIQAAQVDLVASRDPLDGCDIPVRVLGGLGEGAVGALREREASEVASLIAQMKQEEWPIWDAGLRRARPAKLGDVAILLPTRTALGAIEDALEAAGIPARVESESLVFATPEVHDLLAVLGAIDDPTDEVAIVGALRSPAFGCSDGDLVDFRGAGGRWSYLAPAPEGLPASHTVVTAMASLRGLHDRRSWRSVSDTLDALVSERSLMTVALAHRRPRDRWRRIRFLIDEARAFDDRGGIGIRHFVDWCRRRADEGARAVEVIVPESDDDAVRILTVHGAKGLEFPVVFLVGLNTKPRTDIPPVLWSETGPEVSVMPSNGERVSTAGFDGALQHEQRHSEAERIRLLYVAATRARDHLVVSLHRTNDDCLAGRIAACLEGAPCEAVEPGPAVAQPADDASPAPTLTLDERDARLAARAELLARAARPAAFAATTLAKLAGGAAGTPAPGDDVPVPSASPPPPGLDKGESDGADDRPAWLVGRGGTAVGRAVHAVLQTVDLATREGLAQTARAQALAEGIPDREAEVRRLAEHALDAPIVQEAARTGRYWREVPVAAAVGESMVEGFIDLLVETPDGLVVVDYKTDRVGTESDVDRAMDRYAIQGAAYAVALSEGVGLPVSRCIFLFVQPSGAVEREVADLHDEMERVRALLARP